MQQQSRTILRNQLTKTRMCSYHIKGFCKAGNSCCFAHSKDEVQVAPNLQKTRLCEDFAAGRCNKTNCPFAHGAAELRTTEVFYKSKLCTWHEKGCCQNGTSCRFAHSKSELKPQNRHGNGAAPVAPVAAPPTKVDSDYASFMKVGTMDSLDTMAPSDTASTASDSGSGTDSKSNEIQRLQGALTVLSARLELLEKQLHDADTPSGHSSSGYQSMQAGFQTTGANIRNDDLMYSPCYIDIDGACTWDHRASVDYGPYVHEHIWPLAAELNVQEEAAVLAQARVAETVLSELF